MNANWEYKVTNFEDLCFNQKGEQTLLTSHLGILAYRKGAWEHLTPN